MNELTKELERLKKGCGRNFRINQYNYTCGQRSKYGITLCSKCKLSIKFKKAQILERENCIELFKKMLEERIQEHKFCQSGDKYEEQINEDQIIIDSYESLLNQLEERLNSKE